MSSFTTPLEIREDGDGTFTLLAPFDYYITWPDGEVVSVPRGYNTDFASTKPFQWLFPPYHPDYGKAAVVHDYLCEAGVIRTVKGGRQTSKRYCNREEADAIFYQAMTVLGCPAWKRAMMWSAVRAYAIVTRR